MSRLRALVGAAFLSAVIAPVWGATQEELEKKVDELSKQIMTLKGEVSTHEAEDDPTHNRFSWLTVGGDFRVRHDVLGGHSVPFKQYVPGGSPPFPQVEAQSIQNSSLLSTRMGLNLKAQVAEGIVFKTRLVMHKLYGMADGEAYKGPYFADRMAGGKTFDGTVGKIPGDSGVVVENAYADWSDIGGAPVWFSAGRRPSTGGVPTNLRQNKDDEGVQGVNGLLVDYVFDGFSLGYAPEVGNLPGFAVKLCAGRAFQTGYQTPATQSTLKNTDMLGIVFLPIDTEKTRVDFQFQRAFDIMNTIPNWAPLGTDPTAVTANIGDIENAAGGILKMLPVPGGSLHAFGYGGLSLSHPTNDGGLMYSPGVQSASGKQGWSAYTGLRYDIEKSRTKLGAEYNYGSKNWISFTPAADDVLTSKLGTRGNVWETYIIQELNRSAYAPKAKAFFRLGWQYYDFKNTGSNNWVGGSMPISAIDPTNDMQAQYFTPLENAYDVYTTFEVHF